MPEEIIKEDCREYNPSSFDNVSQSVRAFELLSKASVGVTGQNSKETTLRIPQLKLQTGDFQTNKVSEVGISYG